MNSAAMAGNVSDYAYLYGRVSGLIGKLLSSREIDSLIQSRSDNEVLASLESTDYERYLSGLKVGEYENIELERRLFAHLEDVFEDVVGLTPGLDGESIRFYYSGFWDHSNVKTLIRGLHQNMSWRNVRFYVNPLGKLAVDDFEISYASGSMANFLIDVGFVEDEFFNDVLSEYESSGNLEILESFVDSVFYKRYVNKLKDGVLGDIVGLRSDLFNIKTLFLCANYGIEPEKYVVLGAGRLGRDFLMNAGKLEIEELSTYFSFTDYRDLVKLVLKSFTEEGNINSIEKITHSYLINYVKDKSVLNPLSIYSAAYFMERKMLEIKTLRAIILSKKEGLSLDETKSLISGEYV